jgi:DNA-binding beta-propeller fold protein YncE
VYVDEAGHVRIHPAAGISNWQSTVAEIIASPGGNVLYVSNRGHETIAKFDIHPHSGTLTFSQLAPHGGKTSRHITMDLNGQFLLVACQDSGGIVVPHRRMVRSSTFPCITASTPALPELHSGLPLVRGSARYIKPYTSVTTSNYRRALVAL